MELGRISGVNTSKKSTKPFCRKWDMIFCSVYFIKEEEFGNPSHFPISIPALGIKLVITQTPAVPHLYFPFIHTVIVLIYIFGT